MHAVDANHSDHRQSAQWEEETGIFESAGQGEYSRADISFEKMNDSLEIPVENPIIINNNCS